MPSTKRPPAFDVIAIGESLRDVLYVIDEASLSCSINKERCLMCLEYAEKIPVVSVVKTPAAGNAANAAVGAARLGLKTALVTWVGKDQAGEDIRNAIRREHVDTRHLTFDPKHPTSEATILNYQSERTQLVYFQPRTYRMPKLASSRCIYYSAMGEKHASFDRGLAKELARRPETFFTFQPGTTHVHGGLDIIKPLIARSDLFILNDHEAHHLLPDGERTLRNMLESFRHLGAKNVIITLGENGADSYDGTDHWHMPVFDGKPKERTGAGDSFAIGVTVALLNGKPMPEALRWGTANSRSVISEIGPQKGLLDNAGMKKMLLKYKAITAKRLTNSHA
jgi:sugar/nucleoside kinase (ribokinase family)